MICEKNVPAHFHAETRVFLELSFFDAVHYTRASTLIGKYLLAIKPVFAMITANQNS